MQESFEQLIMQVSKDNAIFQGLEEVVRQGVVLPFLAHLGWNTYNVREVIPEFKVNGGRVDYCLRVSAKNAIFIEVKRVTEDLDTHEKQLLEYSFSHGVEIAVLTNGLSWQLYLPLTEGNWSQRKFFTIDIRQQDPKTAAFNFNEFLDRDSIINGSAIKRARSVHDSKRKKRLIDKTIPKAWNQLLVEPDENLLELLSDKIEGMCGHRPEMQQLSEYIMQFSAQKPPEPVIKPKPTPSKKKRSRGINVKIGNQIIEAASVPDLYRQVLKHICDTTHINSIKPHLPYSTSNQRYLISTEPYHPRGNAFRSVIEYNGYYMEAHKSYGNAFKSLVGLFELCGITIEKVED